MRRKVYHYLKFYFLRSGTLMYLFLIFGLIVALNLIIYIDFQFNYREYYEKKNFLDCYIEQYKILKLIQLIRNSFILYTLAIGAYWFKLVKFSWSIYNEPIPFNKLFSNVVIVFFFFGFHLLIGFGALSLFYFELDNLIPADDLKYIPISLQNIFKSLIIDIMTYSMLNVVFLFVVLLLNRYRGLMVVIILIGYIILSKYLIPGYSLITYFNQICPPKEI